MSFRIAHKTLERLEWPALAARLQARCRTPQAHAAVQAWIDAAAVPGEGNGGDDAGAALREDRLAPFALTLGEARERMAETSEARGLVDDEELPTRGGVADLGPIFVRAEKGAVLAPVSLREISGSLEQIHAAARTLAKRGERAPKLSALAAEVPEHAALKDQIDRCIDRGGELRDSASPVLRAARETGRRLAAEVQARLERMLQNANVREALSDHYVTLRGDRYVLPVRADARSKVRGIVHDASNSGTTIFVEPEAVVELNNRLKQAELDAAREAERILRELSGSVAEALPSLRDALARFAEIDLVFARGELSAEQGAVEPEIERDGAFELLQLRHPLIDRDECVPNDLRLGDGFHVLVLSGPNAGGKTVAMKAVALAALCARAGLHVAAAAGARVPLVDAILADIGDEQDIRQSLSTFSGHMRNLSAIVRSAAPRSLVVLDEIGTGTDPGEGAALAQAILEALADAGAAVVATTHFNLLKEMASVDERFCNASVEFDPETLAPTYRVRLGEPGPSSAATVAARMGMPGAVLDRASALLDREDRRLDRMLSELAAARSSLEHEQQEIARLRDESRTTRDEYRHKLEKLQKRRDALVEEMRGDLDRAFREAHEEVAGVIRELQRSGGGTSRERAREAARARSKLVEAADRANSVGDELGVDDAIPGSGDAVPESRFRPLDWHTARPGDPVVLASGVTAVLEELPDRRGRVTVSAGSARLVLPSEQVGAPAVGHSREHRGGVSVETNSRESFDGGGGTAHADIRGLRVEEARDRITELVDRAASDSRDAIRIVHGIGTGALRQAVREILAASPLIGDFRPAAREEGGEGVTEANLRR